jgi:4-amino-4-deoxy-L-arabinose transferase-like glycosyltransferase
MDVKVSDSAAYILAAVLLGIMFFLAFFSMRQNALTFDELAHIPAGYSYLTQQDYRLNPEHPPLVKDISALPLLFLKPNFPIQSTDWTQEAGAPPWWVQFNVGNEFLYTSGNNPLSIIFWSRLPMILLMLALGVFLFFWTRKLLGNGAALGVLALFAFSPSFLAHGTLVTTDVASALGILVAFHYWIEFLKQPTKTKIVKAGAALALAFLFKFSAVLLLPFFGVITLIYAYLHPESFGRLRTAFKYTVLSIVAGIVALFVILPVYQFHILNYPAQRQLRDTIADLQPGGITFYEQAIIAASDKPLLRPFTQFSRGILMAVQRGQFGNTVVLQDNIRAGGFWQYFPLIYLYKIPLTLHILTLFGILGILWAAWKQRYRGIQELGKTWWLKKHFAFAAFDIFIGAYLLLAILGNLNIGVRHLLPILPLLYILIIWGLKELFSNTHQYHAKVITLSAIGALFLWYIASSVMAFPHYIPYYNELAGGTQRGYEIAVDSNYDWGQDFYRLVEFVEANNIQKIHLDYFGGEDPAYWLGEKYVKLNPQEEGFTPNEVTGWIAVSLNQLQGGQAKPIAGFDQPTGYYNWLSTHTPIHRAGNSIFIYYIQ